MEEEEEEEEEAFIEILDEALEADDLGVLAEAMLGRTGVGIGAETLKGTVLINKMFAWLAPFN